MVRNGRTRWGVGLGRKECFFLQTMVGDGLLKSPLGNDVSMQREMLKDIGVLN
jgi:hypothetical protein